MRRAGLAVLLAIWLASPAGAQVPSSRLSGRQAEYAVQAGDTLSSIGARVGVPALTLAFDNRLDPGATLREGQALRIDARHLVPPLPSGSVLVINVAQRMLFLADAVESGVPVAVGKRGWETPTGTFAIASREENPTWVVPASILEEARRAGRTLPPRVPPGPANPLGRFWIGLSGGGVGIHGTNAPRSIHQAVTHGCVRLHPDDIEWLFPRVALGDTVTIMYEPLLLGEIDGRVFLEVHPDVERRGTPTVAALRARADAQGLTARIDWRQAARVVALRHGVARDVTVSVLASGASGG